MVIMRKLAAFLHLSKASSALFNIKQITSTSAFVLFVFTCPHKSFHSFHFIRKRILFARFLYVFVGYRYRPGWNLTLPQSSLCSTRQRARWKSRGWWEGRRVEDLLYFLPTHLTLRSLSRYPFLYEDDWGRVRGETPKNAGGRDSLWSLSVFVTVFQSLCFHVSTP